VVEQCERGDKIFAERQLERPVHDSGPEMGDFGAFTKIRKQGLLRVVRRSDRLHFNNERVFGKRLLTVVEKVRIIGCGVDSVYGKGQYHVP
jgi:hypothetical protein